MRHLLAIILAFSSLATRAEMPPRVIDSSTLEVVTLNLAHGRKDGRNQMLMRGETIRQNMEIVAALMDRSGADVIAFQEADAESIWSGRFNHVDFLTEISRYRHSVHGVHASSRLYDFGTALMSLHPLHDSYVHSFQPSWPTTTKGFVMASVYWNPDSSLPEPVQLRLVSVHLDFSRRSVRQSQITEMVSALEGIEEPLVLMGDFNTDWSTEESSLQRIARELDLHVYEPHAEGLATYGDKKARLDWILLSQPLEFLKYHVEPEVVSDHYAVAAVIGMVQN